MGLSHPFNRGIGANPFCQVKTVVGWKKGTGTSSFPFMSITEALTHGSADERSFTGTDPDDWVNAGDIGKLELINTGFGILGFFRSWIIKWRHVLCPANLLKFTILISDGQLTELFSSPLGGDGMPGYCRVSLANVARLTKDRANRVHLPIGQVMGALKLFE
jgi:hypothetical protein